MGLGLGLFGGGWLFCGAWVLCGNGGEGVVGLGGGLELSLFKGVFPGGGLLDSCLKGCLIFFCCSTLWASTHTSSKVVNCCNSTSVAYLGSSPPNYLTTVCSYSCWISHLIMSFSNSCVYFSTLRPPCIRLWSWITILDVGEWKKPRLKLCFHLLLCPDHAFPIPNPLGTKISLPKRGVLS